MAAADPFTSLIETLPGLLAELMDAAEGDPMAWGDELPDLLGRTRATIAAVNEAKAAQEAEQRRLDEMTAVSEPAAAPLPETPDALSALTAAVVEWERAVGKEARDTAKDMVAIRAGLLVDALTASAPLPETVGPTPDTITVQMPRDVAEHFARHDAVTGTVRGYVRDALAAAVAEPTPSTEAGPDA